jgi:hypothetical protein
LAFNLRNLAGDRISISGGHWAVFLSLAGCFGWVSAGTVPPEGVSSELWNKRYDSSDSQWVTDSDAISLAKYLHGAAVHKKIDMALTDVIATIEKEMIASGVTIHPSMQI